MTRELRLADEAATQALAEAIADRLPANTAGWSILLQGELGAGKSTLARALLRRLGHEGPVPSPTYTLVEPYQLGERTIYHIDLYRIVDPDELQFLGWSDWMDGLMLVEWPERAGALLDRTDLRIQLEYAGDARRARLLADSTRGAALLKELNPVSDRH